MAGSLVDPDVGEGAAAGPGAEAGEGALGSADSGDEAGVVPVASAGGAFERGGSALAGSGSSACAIPAPARPSAIIVLQSAPPPVQRDPRARISFGLVVETRVARGAPTISGPRYRPALASLGRDHERGEIGIPERCVVGDHLGGLGARARDELGDERFFAARDH